MGTTGSKPAPLPSYYNYTIPNTYPTWDNNCQRGGGGKTPNTVLVDDLIAMHTSFNDRLNVPVMPISPGWCSVIAQSDVENTGTPAQLSICAHPDADRYEYVSGRTFQNNTGEWALECRYNETDWIAGSSRLLPTFNIETDQPEQNKLFLIVARESEEQKRNPKTPGQPSPPPPPQTEDKPPATPPPTNQAPPNVTTGLPPLEGSQNAPPVVAPGEQGINTDENTTSQAELEEQQRQQENPPELKGDDWQEGQPRPDFTNGPGRKRDLGGTKVGRVATPTRKRDTRGGKVGTLASLRKRDSRGKKVSRRFAG
ncbi:MAG: hypothetical protein M1831_007478 [Alyxoria varia]|nr:MAG: hypothetical protein M1831_007478 [Alyxoria varia]